jgi:hypothetical protein
MMMLKITMEFDAVNKKMGSKTAEAETRMLAASSISKELLS